MPTDPRALKAIANALIRLIEELRKEERPKKLSFPNPEWRLLTLGRTSVAYRRPETATALAEFRKRFRRADWIARWSTEYVWDAEREVIASALEDSSEQAAMSHMARAAEILDAEPPDYTVVLPLSWLWLGEFTMAFGDIEVRTITADELVQMRRVIYHIISTTPLTEDRKVSLSKEADEITSLLLNHPAAFVPAKGDSPLARDRARKLVEPIADLIQLAAAIHHWYGEVNISVGGDLLTKQPPLLIIAKDGSDVHHERPGTFGHRYEMEAAHLEDMRSRGFGLMIDAISKTAGDRTEFEALLIRSLHWIAEAERHSSVENKTMAYVTAIDMFFAMKDEPLTRDITEGTAFVLASTLKRRREVVKVMAEFYALRSGVSHVGNAVTADDIRGLQGLTISYLAKMSAMSAKFKTKEEFRSWLVDQRLSPSSKKRVSVSRRTARVRRYSRRSERPQGRESSKT